MILSTVEIPRTNARAEALAYTGAARRESDPARRAELEQMAHAYRVAARTDVGLVALTPTITAGGTMTRTTVHKWWGDGGEKETRRNYLLPKLAVCRWQAAFCYTDGIRRGGGVEFSDSLRRRPTYHSGVIDLTTQFELPAGYEPGYQHVATQTTAWAAMVPIVPPRHRPTRGLGDRLVLWEVDDWQRTTVPRPPGDPALLRHVAGDIYAVEAVWHLTELEQLVLSGRRR